MADRAKVTSIEAVESFRTRLLVYLEKAGNALDEISEEVRRTKGWLDHDRRDFWQRETVRRAKVLEQRQQELFSARISGLAEATQVQQMAVQKARRELQAAEDRLRQVRRWVRQYDSRVDPLAREVEKLRGVLGQEMRQAEIVLRETVRILDAYAGVPLRPVTSGGRAAEAEVEPTDAAAAGKERGP
ncbi:MAG: hypothetical protein H7A45_21190 [Verrucomicrobiales bacterium]|nr:hypothetical protein [Verrucomicrobiales bacterium]MCP5525696.1 hypothetical protein [Verrucomicrobiales bacterium]